jgi:transposase
MTRKVFQGSQLEIRKRIVADYLSGVKTTSIAKKYGVYRTSVPRIVRRYKMRKTAERKPGSGRKKILQKAHKIRITRVIRKNPRTTLQELKSISGASCSRYPIRRYLLESGYKSYKVQKKLDLLLVHKLARVNWARSNQHRDWSCVIFSDEASIWIDEVWGRMWTKDAGQARAPHNAHPAKIHIWAAISIYGPVGLHIFEGILTAERYVSILEDHLLWGPDEIFGRGQWVFQQDNDPKHRAHLTQLWLLKNVPSVLEWPSRSPDLNPIENMWAYLKAKVRKRGPKNISELRIVVEEEIRSIPVSYFTNLYESMHTRIERVISCHGECIDY